MKMSILISILLLSCVVVGAEIDYGTIDHTQQGSRFDITGSVVSDKPVDFISIELVMRALEEGASRGLPDITIESDFNNYKMDAGAISDVGLVMVDVLMNPATGRPEEDAMLPDHYRQAFIPTVNKIDFIGLYIPIVNDDPMHQTDAYISLWTDDDGPDVKITDLVIDIDKDIVNNGDLRVGLNLLKSKDGVITVTPQNTYHIKIEPLVSSMDLPKHFFIGVVDNINAYNPVGETPGAGEFNLITVLGGGDVFYDPPRDLAFGTYYIQPEQDFDYSWTNNLEKDSTVYYKIRATAQLIDSGEDIVLESMEYSFDVEGTGVPEPILNETTNTTVNETQTNETVLICPDECEPCSEWSECVDGKHVQICEKCDSDTGYVCKSFEEDRVCKEDAGWNDAFTSLEEAENIISLLRGKVDISEAEILLIEANENFEAGNYPDAYDKAEQAKASAIKADPSIVDELPEKIEDTNWGFVIGGFFVIVVLVVGYTQRVKIIDTVSKVMPSGVVGKFLPGKLIGKTSDVSVCSVCGSNLRSPYKCDFCGQNVCYKHVRTYEGKNICTNCARNKDLI